MPKRADRSEARRDRLLEAALGNVVFDGWTRRAFAHGAGQAGLPDSAVDREFPEGAGAMVEHFADWADRRMAGAVAADAGFAALKVREKVAAAVLARLDVLAPHKEAVRRAIALLALRPVLAARLAWRTADAVWRLCGDTAADFNHYTKRGLLAGVLGTTLLHWLADDSEGHLATAEFLERRIGEVLVVGRAAGRAARLGDAFEAPWRAAAVLRRSLRRGA
jgi:ubiquinone biosynthesis protein COQ9